MIAIQFIYIFVFSWQQQLINHLFYSRYQNPTLIIILNLETLIEIHRIQQHPQINRKIIFQLLYLLHNIYLSVMSTQHTLKPCNICNPVDHASKILLFNLIKMLQKKKCISDVSMIKRMTQSYYIEKYEKSLKKLLNFMFKPKQDIEKLNQNCEHSQIYRAFQIKTGCGKKQLDYFAESLYEFQAKRCYQIQILTNQVKSFWKTIEKQIYKDRKQNLIKIDQEQKLNVVVKEQYKQLINIQYAYKNYGVVKQEDIYRPYYMNNMGIMNFNH